MTACRDDHLIAALRQCRVGDGARHIIGLIQVGAVLAANEARQRAGLPIYINCDASVDDDGVVVEAVRLAARYGPPTDRPKAVGTVLNIHIDDDGEVVSDDGEVIDLDLLAADCQASRTKRLRDVTDDQIAVAALDVDAPGAAHWWVARVCATLLDKASRSAPITDDDVARLHRAMLESDRSIGVARREQQAEFARRPRAKPAAPQHDQWRAWAAEVRADPVHAAKSKTAIARIVRDRHQIAASVNTIREKLTD